MAKVKVSDLAKELGLDSKEVLDKLNGAGLKAARSNSSVDEDEARALFKKSKVVQLKVVKSKPGETVADRKLREFYKKYPHVVAGSVRDPDASDKKALGSKCHGKVCTIKCVDTGELRVINTQDAFQVKRCEAAQLEFLRKRRAERRQAKSKAKKAQS